MGKTSSITPPLQPQRRQGQTVSTTPPRTNSNNNRSFYSYVARMSDTQLINTINGQYRAIKGTWTLAPCMGIYGSIEFAATLLLWRYAVSNFDRNQKAYASLQIALGDIICCAFFGMPAGEWSDKVDPIINAHTDILTYDEFGDVYNYLKDDFIDEIHSLEFNKGNAKEETYRQLYTKFAQVYNSAKDLSKMIDFYTAKGLKIKDDILPQTQTASTMPPKGQNTDIKEDTTVFLLLQKWELGYGNFTEDWNVDVPPTLTDKFYVSSYRCPTCGRHMHKTVFPIGKESPIKIGEEYVFMKRVFTCATCQTFYAPLPEHKLSYGQFYFLKSLEYYDLLLAIYDKQGTTEGRPDA